MTEEPRFDWPTIFRSVAIIVGASALVGFAIPPLLTLAFGMYNTGYAAGNDIFNWGFWIAAWIATFVQGAYFLKHVGTKIVDDMLVVAIGSMILLVIVKFIVAIVYLPITQDGQPLPLMTGIDAGGALMIVVVALIAARMNRY
jgi:hypothetical protein